MSRILIFIFVAIGLCTQASASLIVNGDFESGNTGFASSFTNAALNSGAKTYVVVTDPKLSHPSAASYGDHTSGSGLMMAVNGSTSVGDMVWSQTVSVSTGTTYDFGVWHSSWFLPPAGSLQLRINDVDVGPQFATTSPVATWSQFTTTWDSQLSTSAKIELYDMSTASTGNDYALDDITFSAVPEPTSFVMFGLALVGFARRRK